MNTKEPEAAKLKALQEAACMGWADIAAGRHADVADGQLEVSLHSWDSRRRLPSLPAARLSPGIAGTASLPATDKPGARRLRFVD